MPLAMNALGARSNTGEGGKPFWTQAEICNKGNELH